MKLFENGVGRPSNEIKKKRRIFIASIVAIIAIVLTVGGVLLTKSLNENELKGAAAEKLILKCPDSVGINEPFICQTNGTLIRASHPQNLAKGYKEIYKASGTNKKASGQFKYTKKGTIYVKATLGKESKQVKVKVEDKLSLICPTKMFLDKESVCYTNYSGVKISIGGAKSLESGYTASFTTTSETKAKAIKYTKNLFKNYIKLTKKDKNGESYVPVTITASKKGYKTVKKQIPVYRPQLKLDCPDYASINTEFKCTTNYLDSEITIGGANSLEKGYKSVFGSNSAKSSVSIKYTDKLFVNYKNLIKKDSRGEYVPARVIATRGKQIKEEVINIYKSNSVLYLDCPSTSRLEEFKCYTNEVGVKITVSNETSLAKGYTASFVTTSKDMEKSIKYTERLFDNKALIKKNETNNAESVAITVTASKAGKKTEIRKVKVYKEYVIK